MLRKKKHLAWLLFAWLFSLESIYSQEVINHEFTTGPYRNEKQVIRLYSGATTYEDFFFSKQLLQYSIDNLIENYYEGAVNQFLSTGDFSFSDNYVFTFLGNSWIWNKYYYNGVNVNDAFFSGKTYHKLPPLGNSVTLDAINGSLAQNTQNRGEDFLYQEITIGGLGQHIPYYRFFFDDYTQQAPQVSSNPPTKSRDVVGSFKSYGRKTFPFKSKGREFVFLNDIFISLQKRNFAKFDGSGFAGLFRDSSLAITLNNEFYRPAQNDETIGLLATYQYRSNLFAEFYFTPEQTANYNGFALTAYYLSSRLLTQKHAVTLATKTIRQNGLQISKNIIQQSGEAIYPFYPSVSTLEITQDSFFSYGFSLLYQDFLKISSRFNNSFTFVNPERQEYLSTTFFSEGNPANNVALYLSEWTAGPFAYFLLENQISLEFNKIKRTGFLAEGEIGLTLNGFAILGEESLVRFAPFFNFGLNILNDYFQFLRIEIGRKNIPFSSQYPTFLSDAYQSAQNYLWEDANNNLIYESGEKSSVLHSTTGGKYHQIEGDFRQPHYYYIDIPYNISIATKNQVLPLVLFGSSLHYRIFKNQVWVKQGRGNQGSYETIEGQRVYFPAYGEKNYVVYNLPSDFFPERGRNWFNDSPFYLGATIKVATQGVRFYASLSFTAYLINGITTLGNGPLYNSGGTIAESQADPNQNQQNVGRLDGDRSYVGKLLVNFWPVDFMAITATLKYQDGQPIGKWGYYESSDSNNNNVALVRENVSGDNLLLYNGEFGTREDAWFIFDLKFLFLLDVYQENDFSIYLNFYNLLDVGRSLLELTFFPPNQGSRDVIEIQIPRGIQIGLKFNY